MENIEKKFPWSPHFNLKLFFKVKHIDTYSRSSTGNDMSVVGRQSTKPKYSIKTYLDNSRNLMSVVIFFRKIVSYSSWSWHSLILLKREAVVIFFLCTRKRDLACRLTFLVLNLFSSVALLLLSKSGYLHLFLLKQLSSSPHFASTWRVESNKIN